MPFWSLLCSLQVEKSNCIYVSCDSSNEVDVILQGSSTQPMKSKLIHTSHHVRRTTWITVQRKPFLKPHPMATRLSIASPALTATKRIQAPIHSSGFLTSENTSYKKPTERRLRYRQTHRPFHTTRSLKSTSPKYTYRIAASFTAKDEAYNPSKNKYNFNPSTKIQVDPHNKALRPDSGQDSFFVSQIRNF